LSSTPMHAPTDLPSSGQLVRATLFASVVASLILVTIVLPVEYGLDPLGTGRASGLFRPRTPTVAAPKDDVAPLTPRASVLVKSATPFRSDEMTVRLESGEGVEIKASMTRGQRLVYSWASTGGAVDVDMHGEAVGAADDEYTSYWKDEGQTHQHGALDAPVTGNHGWYWQNLNDTPVTITVKVSGFYEKLHRP
jgi:hypothetical protein